MNANPCYNHVSQFELSKITLKNLNKFKISPTAKLVLTSLTGFFPKIFPSQQTIANELGISKRSVERAISELRSKGLVLTSANKKTLNYTFSNIFLGQLGLSVADRQNVVTDTDKLANKQITNNKQNNKSNLLNFQMTEFQKKYYDVLEKLSEEEMKKYKSLKGFEKEDWLKNKRKDFAWLEQSKKQIEKENSEKQNSSNAETPLEGAIKWLANLPESEKNCIAAKMIRKKFSLQ